MSIYIIEQMIIITVEDDVYDPKNIQKIAATAFNMERGKVAFDEECKLVEGTLDDCSTIENDGITYHIQGSTGKIILYGKGGGIANKLGRRLAEIMLLMDERYLAKHGGIEVCLKDSSDYIRVSASKSCDINRKFVGPGKNVPRVSTCCDTCFTWVMSQNGSANMPHVDSSARDLWECEWLTSFNTLVIDANNIFKAPDDNILVTNTPPAFGDYVMSDRFVSQEKYKYSREFGIDYELRNRVLPNSGLIHRPNTDKGFFLIYNELWENIKPIRTSSVNYGISLVQELLQSEYTIVEADEITKPLYDQAPNWLCNGCGMYLYGDIYALEHGDNHVCVCAKCFHMKKQNSRNTIVPSISKLGFLDSCTILRVKHPSTVVDIINRIDMDEISRTILTELSQESVTIRDNCISSPNFEGIACVDKVLRRIVIPCTYKKLFICEICS